MIHSQVVEILQIPLLQGNVQTELLSGEMGSIEGQMLFDGKWREIRFRIVEAEKWASGIRGYDLVSNSVYQRVT